MTARELGKYTNRTAQEINKRLIANGLMYNSLGRFYFTELGERYGKEVVKIKRNNFVFANMEWDLSVINLIFSEEELRTIGKEKMELFHRNHYRGFGYKQ